MTKGSSSRFGVLTVSVGQHNEVIAFDVAESEKEVFPSIFPDQLCPLLEAILVPGIAGVDDIEEDVVEEGLKGGDIGIDTGQ